MTTRSPQLTRGLLVLVSLVSSACGSGVAQTPGVHDDRGAQPAGPDASSLVQPGSDASLPTQADPDASSAPQAGPDASTPPPPALPVTFYSAAAITDSQLPGAGTPPTQPIASIWLVAARGEFEPARFLVHADADVSAVQVAASALSAPGLPDIPASAVDIRILKKWYQAGVRIWDLTNKQLVSELLVKDDSLIKVENGENYLKLATGGYAWISDPGTKYVTENPECVQLPGDFPVKDSAALLPVDLVADQNKDFVVTVRVPDGAGAGDYTGTITLAAPDGHASSLAVRLKVLPFQLAAPILTYSVYYRARIDPRYPDGTLNSFYRSEAQVLSDLTSMVNHGITNPGIEQVLDNSPEAAKMLSARAQAGITAPELFWLGLSVGWASDPGYLAGVKSAVATARAVAAPYGVTDLYVYGRDEASPDVTTTERVSFQAVHEAGGKVFVAGHDIFSTVGDLLDLIVRDNEPSAAVAAQWHGAGHRIFNYSNPQTGEERPETYRRNYGLLLWQTDQDGAMDYAYQASEGCPWNDFDHVTLRDGNFTYPTVDGSIDTIEYEGFREGVDDVRYLSTLLALIERRRAQGADVSAAEAFVGALKADPLADLDAVRASIVQQILSFP